MYRLMVQSRVAQLDQLLGEIKSLRNESAADPGYGYGKGGGGGAAGISPVSKGPAKRPMSKPSAGKK